MQEQRKIIIIKSNFQNDLIIKTVLTTFITLNVVITVAYVMTGPLFVDPLAIQTFMYYLAGLEVVSGGIIYYISRDISFHIAGPVYALERTLLAMGGGDLSISLKLRKGDHFTEVSEVLNETMTVYRLRIQALQDITNEIKIKTDNQQDVSAEFDALAENLSFFKLEKDQVKD
jgi:methyl-accepting chemotaxis protein